jgi:putative membrane protein
MAGLSFAVLNSETVPLNYYFGDRNLPLSLVVVIAFALGAAVGGLFSLALVIRLKREMARLRRIVRLNEKEILNLRSIPIKDSH